MAENSEKKNSMNRFRYRGRISQILIYFGKFIRMFINQNDWKVLPLSAAIAGMAAMVVRSGIFQNMEDTLKGALALSCVAMWNGCFNSIQSICRERGIVKREHRSGMHIFAYVTAHVLYQALLCLIQTVITIVVCLKLGMKFPSGEILQSNTAVAFNPMVYKIGVTIFLTTFAADMISLLISGLVHSTTAAMTVMPFILVFQLVFSGVLFSVPKGLEKITNLTISKYSIRCLASQGNYNALEMPTGWNLLNRMRDTEIPLTMTAGQVLDFLSTSENESVKELTDTTVIENLTVGELLDYLDTAESESAEELRQMEIMKGFNVGQLLDWINSSDDEAAKTLRETMLVENLRVRDVIEFLRAEPELEDFRNEKHEVRFTIGELIEAQGEENVRARVMNATAEASRRADFENTEENIRESWMHLTMFALICILLTMIELKFIDKDKR